MASYSKEFKERMVARLLPPNNEPISKVARENNVNEVTLRKWKKKAIESGMKQASDVDVKDKYSSQEKFMIVIETASMSEVELSKYARRKGLYPEQIKGWKEVCVQANGGIAQEASRLNKELKHKDKEIRSLEKELQRKEKALAEAAAILVLRKKLNTLLEIDEKEE